MLTVLIVLTIVVLPTDAYALSLYRVPPSKFVIYLIDLLLKSIIVLFIISFSVFAFWVKSGKTVSKFAKLTIKFFTVAGILLLVVRLALIFAPWELIDNYYLKNFKYRGQYQPYPITIVTEKIVVGFKNEVSQEEAEEYLKSKKVEFASAEDVNMGKVFFYNTGLKYIVVVSSFEPSKAFITSNWIAEFESSPLIYDAAIYSSNSNELID